MYLRPILASPSAQWKVVADCRRIVGHIAGHTAARIDRTQAGRWDCTDRMELAVAEDTALGHSWEAAVAVAEDAAQVAFLVVVEGRPGFEEEVEGYPSDGDQEKSRIGLAVVVVAADDGVACYSLLKAFPIFLVRLAVDWKREVLAAAKVAAASAVAAAVVREVHVILSVLVHPTPPVGMGDLLVWRAFPSLQQEENIVVAAAAAEEEVDIQICENLPLALKR